MYELLVFDWDGTLMDSEARIVGCIRAAAADLGVAPPTEASAREIIGLGLREALARLFPGEDRQMHDRLVARYRDRFLVLDKSRSELFPGVRDALSALRDANYLLAVATGKSRRGLDRELGETGLGPLFHASRCADETFSKPHPQMLLELMDELGAGPRDTLVVGDTEFDVQMAANAGVQALGVSYGVHGADRLRSSGALHVLDRLDQIHDWLASPPRNRTGTAP